MWLLRLRSFALMLVVSCCAIAGGNPADLRELQERLAPLTSLSATFTQTVTGADGFVLQTLTGTMTVARPGKIYWHSEDPYPQLVVSDATTLWLYDPDLEQVTVRPFQRDISKTPAILFIGEVSGLDDSYQVTAHDDNGTVSYTLIPQDQQSLYREINLTFSGDKPVAMSLLDTLGQQTRIDLSDVQSNQAIDPLLFDFVVPDGADVLYDD